MKKIIVILFAIALLSACKKEDVKPQIITNTVTNTVYSTDTIYCIKRKEIFYGDWIIYGQSTGSGNILYYTDAQTTTFNATHNSFDFGDYHYTATYSSDYSIINYTLVSSGVFGLNVYNCDQFKLTNLNSNDPTTQISYYLKRAE